MSEDLNRAPSLTDLASGAVEQWVLAAFRPNYGNRTWHIAKRINRPTAVAYRILLRLERRGLVSRHPHYSACNDIFWVRTDERPEAAHETAREPNQGDAA